MTAYRVPSPFGGPDAVVQRPTKPVRLHLQPSEALVLFVMLEQAMQGIDQADKPPPDGLVDTLSEIHGKLLERLEVDWQEPTTPKRGK